MKEPYQHLEMEVIAFDAEDIIVNSGNDLPDLLIEDDFDN